MENNQNRPDNLKKRILDQIQNNQVQMRSTGFFVLRTAGLVAIAGLILILTIFLCNFLIFALRVSGEGGSLFLRFFPWPFLLFDIGLIIFLYQILKNFRWGYEIPAAFIFLALVVLAIFCGFVLDREFGVNDQLYEHARHHQLPMPFNRLYEVVPHREEEYEIIITPFPTQTMPMQNMPMQIRY